MHFRAVGAAAFLALAIPATASGAVRCVDNPGGACDTNHGTIQLAVTAAADGDTIRIAPGTYVEAIDTAKRLTFDGAGAGTVSVFNPAVHTRIRPADIGSGTASPALRLTGGGSVRDLQATGGSTDVNSIPGAGLALEPTAGGAAEVYAVTNVLARAGAGNGFSKPGLLVTDDAAPGAPIGATVTDSVVQPGVLIDGANVSANLARITAGVSNFFIAGVEFQDGAGGSLRDSRVEKADAPNTGIGRGVQASDGADLAVERVSVVVDFRGLGVSGDNSRMTFKDGSVFTLDAAISGTFIGGAVVNSFAVPARLTITGSTLISLHHAGDGGVGADGAGALAEIRNTVVRSISDDPNQGDLSAEDGGRITATNSAFRTRFLETGGSASAPGSPTNISADPLLGSLTPTGLALQPTSPLIDAGSSAFVSAGELDLAGVARSLDGNGDCAARPDIGAFERPATSPASCVEAVRIGSASASNKTFAPVRRGGKVAAKKRKKPKRGTRFRYTLSEAATVRVVIERVTRGRRIRVKGKRVCAKPTRKRRKRKRCKRYKRVTTLTAAQVAGRQSLPFTGRVKGKALKPGKYRARLSATDSQGARSSEKRLALKIVKP